MLVEGMLIAAFALGAKTNFIYTRGEYKYLIDIMDQALDEARRADSWAENSKLGLLVRDLYAHRRGRVHLRRRDGVAELVGRIRGHPRMKPPFPRCPAYMPVRLWFNNVETLTAVPDIIKMGGEAYQKLGTEKSGGTKTLVGLRTCESSRRSTSSRWVTTTWKSSSWKIARAYATAKPESGDSRRLIVYIMRARSDPRQRCAHGLRGLVAGGSMVLGRLLS